MANAQRDQNNVPTLLAGLSTDGVTPTRVAVNPVNHGMKVDEGSSGSDFGPSIAPRDQNSVPVAMGVSSVDGVTPVVIYADASGHLLIDQS